MQPQSPNPNFDFMLKDNPQPKRGFGLPHLSKPLKIILGAVVGIVVLIVVSSVLSGRNNGNNQPIIGALSRAQETLRVTTLAQQNLHFNDPQTQVLAATVSSSLTSDKKQLLTYLAKNNTKVTAVQLAAVADKTTDASLQSASQNNSLDSAYINYLKDALTKYENDLQAAYKTAGSNGKKLLSSSAESTRTLLNSAPIKS